MGVFNLIKQPYANSSQEKDLKSMLHSETSSSLIPARRLSQHCNYALQCQQPLTPENRLNIKRVSEYMDRFPFQFHTKFKVIRAKILQEQHAYLASKFTKL